MAGRKEGSKNIQKKGKKKVNQHGVTFTQAEEKKLRSLVNSANRKAKRLREEFNAMEYYVGGTDTGYTIGEIPSFIGRENDFVLQKKSKSLNKFRSKEDFKRYLKNLENVVQRDYIDRRIDLYKQNHIKALENAFHGQADDIIADIMKLNNKDYMKIISSDETLNIKYIDSTMDEEEYFEAYKEERTAQLKTLRTAVDSALERSAPPIPTKTSRKKK